MVFIIQNTQNRESSALQLKVDELLRAVQGAHNTFINLEELSEEDLDDLKEKSATLAQRARLKAGRDQAPGRTASRAGKRVAGAHPDSGKEVVDIATDSRYSRKRREEDP
jgi:low affinity Fe/Cu permease